VSQQQFDAWLRQRGIAAHNGRYYIPCLGQTKAIGPERALTVTMSTGSPDRHGDILEPAGADLSAFRRNPVVLWAHRYDEFPIARADAVWVEGNQLAARVTFDSRPFAQEARRLYAEGFLAAWSVGCLPRQWKVLHDEQGRFAGYHITAWELLELSAVPVPANPEALSRELRGGRIADGRLCKDIGDLLNAHPALAAAGGGQWHAAPARPATMPEVCDADLAEAILPRLIARLREWALQAAEREIRRRQGRIVPRAGGSADRAPLAAVGHEERKETP